VQVLGDGELSKALTIKAAKFSSSAAEKIAAAGATAESVPQRAKWTRKAHERVRGQTGFFHSAAT
jgi:large subunit ribosomal protein L15